MAALSKPTFACALALGLTLFAAQDALAQRQAAARRTPAPEPNPLRFTQAPPPRSNDNSADNLFSDEREPAPPPVPQRPANDPTIPGPEIRQLLEAGNVAKPASGPAGLPPMRIRARVLARDRVPAALIEVGDQLHSIRKGTELQIPTGKGADEGTATLRVTNLDMSEIRFEMNGRKQALILH